MSEDVAVCELALADAVLDVFTMVLCISEGSLLDVK